MFWKKTKASQVKAVNGSLSIRRSRLFWKMLCMSKWRFEHPCSNLSLEDVPASGVLLDDAPSKTSVAPRDWDVRNCSFDDIYVMDGVLLSTMSHGAGVAETTAVGKSRTTVGVAVTRFVAGMTFESVTQESCGKFVNRSSRSHESKIYFIDDKEVLKYFLVPKNWQDTCWYMKGCQTWNTGVYLTRVRWFGFQIPDVESTVDFHGFATLHR